MDSAAELKLPFGITDFAQIRTDGYYYVDKTQFIEDYCSMNFVKEYFTQFEIEKQWVIIK